MTKVVVVDIHFRQRTKSTAFLVDLLRQSASDVAEFHWDPADGIDALSAALRAADVAVLIQLEVLSPLCSLLGVPSVAVPMYDGVANSSDEYWAFINASTYANFCLSLHLRLRGLGYASQHHKYFPAPSAQPRDFSTGLHGFLWERRPGEALDWPTVNHFFGSFLTTLHVHTAADPGYTTSDIPRRQGTLPYRLTTSKWRRNPAEYRRALEKSNVYFAPRRTEGIGLSFLEAFSQGSCVVAFDSSTHNEYIADGLTGILLPDDLHSFPGTDLLDRAAELASEGWHMAVAGHERWATIGGDAFVRQILDTDQIPETVGHDLGSMTEILAAWGSGPRFDALVGEALRRSEWGGRARGRSSVTRTRVEGTQTHEVFSQVRGVDGGTLRDSGVLLEPGQTAAFHVARPSGAQKALVVRVSHALGASCEVYWDNLVMDWPIGTQQSLLLGLDQRTGGDSAVTLTAHGQSVEVVDVLTTDAQHLSRTVGADIDCLGLDSNMDAGLRDLLVGWLVATGTSPLQAVVQGRGEALLAHFDAWSLQTYLNGTALPAAALARLAAASWQARSASTDDGYAYTELFRVVSARRREADPAWAERYPRDDWFSLAWFYLHGVDELDLGPLVGPEERAWLLGDGSAGPLVRLLDRWRAPLGEQERHRPFAELGDQHPGLVALGLARRQASGAVS